MFLGFAAGALADKLGIKAMVVIGPVISIIGLACLAVMNQSTPTAYIGEIGSTMPHASFYTKSDVMIFLLMHPSTPSTHISTHSSYKHIYIPQGAFCFSRALAWAFS